MIALQVRDVVGIDFDLYQIRFQFRGHGQAPPLDELLDDEELEEDELVEDELSDDDVELDDVELEDVELEEELVEDELCDEDELLLDKLEELLEAEHHLW